MNLLYTLTSGRIGYVSMVLALIFLIALKVFLPTDNGDSAFGLALAIFICQIPFYLKLSLRVVNLMHSLHAKLVPNFFPKLKKSIFTLVALSLIPSLLLLPNIHALAVLCAWQMFAVLFIMIAYKYKTPLGLVIGVVIANPIISYLLSMFNIEIPDQFILYILSEAMVYCLPIWVGLFVWIVFRLEKHRLSASRIAAIKRANQGDIFNNQKAHQLGENTETKSYWSQDNFPRQLATTVITKLFALQPLPKAQLLAIATGSINYMTLHFMLTGFCSIAVIFIVAALFDAGNGTSSIFLVLGCGGGVALSMFQFVIGFNNNKSYLARLRLTPLFANEKQFNRALLHCYLLHQLKSIAFILTVTFSYFVLFTTVNHTFYLQIISANILTFCALTSLFIVCLRTSKLNNFRQIWGPLVIGFSFGFYNLLQYFGHQPLSSKAQYLVAAAVISTTVVSLLIWQKKGINWCIT
jgi:hypothetical protein